MKRLILFELMILFLATTFESDSPPGWYQQVLPVNDQINDIFFLDSSNGWVVTLGKTSPPDTGYIMRTSNGGNNWSVQYSLTRDFNSIQFVDLNTGYAGGGSGNGTRFLYKTTNGGINWVQILGSIGVGSNIVDLNFINKDTGWICDDNFSDGGLFKTTNGGVNWIQQLNNTYRPVKLFFINKDTGWVGTSDASGRLFRTTNGGVNWNLQFTSIASIGAIFFINSIKGWIRGGTSGTNGVAYTTNGGINWINGQGEIGGYDIKFITDSIGYAGGGSQPLRIIKSTDGGKNWGYQTAQITPDVSVAVLKNDTLNIWAGRQLLVHTTDGGGPITYLSIHQTGTEIPSDYKLFQNYPNPFNPVTNIVYELKVKTFVKLKVFDVTGKEITDLVNREQQAGTYKIDWNPGNLPSGVYFYSLVIEGITIDTKKMILVK